MLSLSHKAWFTTLLFLGALLVGSLLGAALPGAPDVAVSFVDPLLLLLVGALFFTLRLEGFSRWRGSLRTALLAVAVNFAAIPALAFGLTALIPDEALRLGVLIYCLAPCTDWFLGFTRLARGDTTTGAALIPVQMTLQLALYPLWLVLFAGLSTAQPVLVAAAPTFLTWFVLPAAVGLGLRLLLRLLLAERVRKSLLAVVDAAVPFLIAGLIVAIFAANVGTVLADPGAFGIVLVVVFLFFVVTFFLAEAIARLFRLAPAGRALLTMTTSARNAPLMLAVTTIALPDQPVVAAAIVLGMLIEFPHLTVITQLLRRPERSIPVRRVLVSR